MQKPQSSGGRAFSNFNNPLKNLILMGILISTVNIGNVFSAPVFYDQGTSGAGTVSIDSPNKPKSEGNTGALQYNYKLNLPEGRSGMTPDISINYNSQNENNQNWVGFGFDLTLPYIQRVNKNGINKLYTDENFSSNTYGELVKSTSSQIFVPRKNDTSRAEFTRVNDTWEVKDNSGMKYVYGGNNESRINSASSTSEIHTWYLTEAIDVFGNSIKYTYSKDDNFVYPQSILYTNHPNQPGIYEVRFTFENRPDQLESYQTGYLIKNNKRLFGVEVFVNNNKTKNFAFRYLLGVNGKRSLLAGITESAFGENGTLTTLPETIFNYSKNETESKTLNIPKDNFDRIADINGDGLNDLVYSRVTYFGDYYSNSRSLKKVYINNGDFTFTEKLLQDFSTNCNAQTNPIPIPNCREIPQVEIPFYLSEFHSYANLNVPVNNFFYDYDSDGNPDVLGAGIKGINYRDIIKTSTSTILVGTTTQIIVATSTERLYATSTMFWESASVPSFTNGFRVANLNGDKVPDLQATSWFSNSKDSAIDSAYTYLDINGDGLDDAIKVWKENIQVYIPGVGGAWTDKVFKNIWLNNGKELVLLDATSSEQYSFPISYYSSFWNGYTFYNNIYTDTNFDGFTESIERGQDSGFSADLNGDGLPDIALGGQQNNTTFSVTASKMKPDLLTSIKNNLGGESNFEYAPAISYKKTDGTRANKIGYPVWTLKKEMSKDGMGITSTREYTYEDASVIREGNFENTLAGFGKVTTTEANGLKTISYYHQGNENSPDEIEDKISKVGKLYKQEVYNKNNSLEKRDLISYQEILNPLTSSSTVIVPVKNISSVVDQNNGQIFTTASEFVYDNNLNKIKEVNYGDVSISTTATSSQIITDLNIGDTKVLEIPYNNSTIQTKKYLPTSKILKDINGNVLAKESYFYDNNLDSTISNGLLTQKNIYTGTTSKQTEKTIWDTTFGLPTGTINSRGATSTIEYDSAKLFPIKSTNALGQVNTFTYDQNTSKVKKSIDQNNLESRSEYDGFGRVIKSFKNNNLLEERTYNDVNFPDVIVKKYFTATDTLSSVTYFDGFGKVVKTKTETVNNNYATTDTTYDEMGNVVKESLPYTTYTLGRSDSVILPDYNFKNYVRDSFGRIVETKIVLGVDKINYGARNKTVYDKNNHATGFMYDKDGLIVEVKENNLGAVYTTKYTYDILGNLVDILDAENGKRNLKYDFSNRKVYDELTNTGTSTSFINTSYGEINEFVENIYSSGEKLKTNFDILGRKLNEVGTQNISTATYITVGTSTVATTSIISTQNIFSDFTYDSCQNGLGKLCVASSSDGIVKKNSYNNNGDVEKVETIVNNSIWAPNSTQYFVYDLLGNILSTGDGVSTATNELVKGKLKSTYFGDFYSTTTKVFENPEYNVLGQIVSYDRGILRTQNTYDDTKLNRINNTISFIGGNNSYDFGNIAYTTLPTNISTTTATVVREKGLSGQNLIQVSKNSAEYIYSTNPYTNISVVKTLHPYATAIKLTQPQARAGIESYYGPIPSNCFGFAQYTVCQTSPAQYMIDAMRATTWMRGGTVESDMLRLFGTTNPISIDTPAPANLTINTLDAGLVFSTDRSSGLATTSLVDAYYNFFVKEKVNQINDDNSFVQLFKRNGSMGMPVWPDSGQTFNQCATSSPYSDKIYFNTIATNTWLKVDVNPTFLNDYVNGTGYIGLCLLTGHSATNAQITLATTTPSLTNSLSLSHNFQELYYKDIPENAYKIYAGLNLQYNASNTKPVISNLSATKQGQGLTPNFNVATNDTEKDITVENEVYVRAKSNSTSTSNFIQLENVSSTSLATTSYLVDNFPFTYATDYEVFARSRDIHGDWSEYATSTFVTSSKSDRNTNTVFCKSITNTDFGSVNCPDPIFNILSSNNFGQIIIATSTNISSTTIDSFLVNKTETRYVGNKLKKNAKYYYKLNDGTTNVFTTGDFKSPQNTTYSYDTLSRIKSILRDEDAMYLNTIYSYDELSRLTQVEKEDKVMRKVDEVFTYSPTGKILSNTGANYEYNSSLAHTPTKVANGTNSDVLNWDNKGRLASSTSLGDFTWNGLDRVKELKKISGIISTTSKYFYDTEGNRVLSFVEKNIQLTATTSSSTIMSRFFTPNQSIQNTGSTTSYQITLGSKPILNIDRVWKDIVSQVVSTSTQMTYVATTTPVYTTATITIPVYKVSTSTVSKSLWVGLRETTVNSLQWDEFKGIGTSSMIFSGATITPNTINYFVGKNGATSSNHIIKLNNLTNATQTLTLYFAGAKNNKSYATSIIEGTGNILQGNSFTIGGTASGTLKYFNQSTVILLKSNTPDITLAINSATATTTPLIDNYYILDSYLLALKNLKYATTTTNTTVSTTTLTWVTSTTTVPITVTSTTTILTPTSTLAIQTILTDQLNSIEKYLDFKTGQIISTSTYKAFGNVDKVGNTNGNRGYTNHQYDKDNSLLYMNARYNSPGYGVFISSDEATQNIGNDSNLKSITGQNTQEFINNPQVLNAYSYVLNNPIMMTDPTGKAFVLDDAVGFVLGGIVGSTAYLGVNLVSESESTWAGYTGAFVTGGILGVGVVNTPETIGTSNAIAAGVAFGYVAGYAGNTAEQTINIVNGKQVGGLNLTQTMNAGVWTGATNGTLSLLPGVKINGITSGQNSMKSVGQAVQTKINNGTVQNMSVKTATKIGLSSQVSEGYKTISGGVLDYYKFLLANKKENK